MSLEIRITEAATEAVSRLDADLRARLTVLSDELHAAAAAAGAAEAAHTEAINALQDEIVQLRAEVADRDRQLADLDHQANSDQNTHAVTLARFRQRADAPLADAEKTLVEAVRQAQLHEEQSKAAARHETPPVTSHDATTRHLRIVQRPTLETSMGDAIEQARRVARLLVSEIRLNRELDVMEGRAQGDLGMRLGEDIERARRQYIQRVPEALPGRETLFDEEVVRTLANGGATLLRTGS